MQTWNWSKIQLTSRCNLSSVGRWCVVIVDAVSPVDAAAAGGRENWTLNPKESLRTRLSGVDFFCVQHSTSCRDVCQDCISPHLIVIITLAVSLPVGHYIFFL